MKNYWLICLAGIVLSHGQLCTAGGIDDASRNVIKVYCQKEDPRQRFAVSKLAEAVSVVPSSDPDAADIVIFSSTTLGASGDRADRAPDIALIIGHLLTGGGAYVVPNGFSAAGVGGYVRAL